MGAFIKLAQAEINVYTVGFLRFGLGLIIISPYIFYSNFHVFNTNNLKLHFLRSSLNCPAMYLGFAALAIVPLEKFTAIHFIVPLFVTILAVIFLKEKIYFFRTSALIIGLIGMLIMLRPGIINIDIGIQMVILSSLIWSICIVLTKTLAKDDSSITILTYQYCFMTVFTFIIGYIFLQIPSMKTFLYVFSSAACGTIFHIALNHAYKLVDLTLTQPFSFLSLVWGSLYGYFLFGDNPDLFTWIGGTVIFSGVLIITYRESYLKKDITKESLPMKS